MLLVQENFRKNMAFYVCLLDVLGSQGIVVKCTTAIFFCTVDCLSLCLPREIGM